MTSTTENIPKLKKVFWQDVCDQVAQVAPEFARLVDDLSPGKSYPLYLAHYPYGSVLVKDGIFQLPTPNGKLATADDACFPASLKNDFAYTGHAGKNFPAGILLHNALDLFIKPKYGFTPWALYEKGAVFGFWAYLDEPSFHPLQLFTITSGARSIFMLPNISDQRSHQKLCSDFGLKKIPLPRTLLDHWPIFKALANHPANQCDWHAELLFLTSNWMKKIKSKDPQWLPLSTYLYKRVWQSFAYWRNKIFYDFALSQAQANCKLKPNPYLARTAKFLLNICTGDIPAYGVATDNSVAPIDLIQKIYLENYRLEKYAPTMMRSMHFSLLKKCLPVYYSLHLPSAFEFAPRPRKLLVHLQDMRELKDLVGIYLREIKSGRLQIEDTPFGEIAENVNFEFFHNRADREGYTTLTPIMPEGDARLIACPEGFGERAFAYFAPFLRGCIRISKANQ